MRGVTRRSVGNPLVYLDLSINGEAVGRVIIELFKDVAPKVRCTLD